MQQPRTTQGLARLKMIALSLAIRSRPARQQHGQSQRGAYKQARHAKGAYP
jgi:hypothetical protein